MSTNAYFDQYGGDCARQRVAIRLALEVPVEPLDLLVAPVRVGDRVDEHDQVLADALDHRLLGDRQPIGQLQHGFGRSRSRPNAGRR